MSPVAYHRWVFRRHEKERLLKLANVQALIGLSFVAFAVACAVWLVLTVVGLDWPVAWHSRSVVTASFAVLWFVLPITDRLSSGDRHAAAERRM